MYFNGEGVRQDLVLGQMWSTLAAAQGNDSAAHTRDIFSKKMTRLQLVKAKLQAIECELSKFKRCD
jgi:TPR repeat protein